MQSFFDVVKSTVPHLRKRCLLVLHTTPLHPSPATPLVYAPVNLHTTFDQVRGKMFFKDGTPDQYRGDKMLAMHSTYNESNWSLVESVIVERFSEAHRKLLDLICFNKKFNSLKSADKIRYCEQHFDMTDLLRRYETSEQVPSWVCESYLGWDKIRKMRDVMVKKMDAFANK